MLDTIHLDVSAAEKHFTYTRNVPLLLCPGNGFLELDC